MEYKSDKMMCDFVCESPTGNNESTPVEDLSMNSSHSETEDKDVLKNSTRAAGDVAETKIADWKGGGNSPKGTPLEEIDASGDVNMEALITTDDVIRAGGFGARDDISSFLPVASDSTDFEASIRDARDYEGPPGEVSRPGLGWTGATKGE